MLLNIKQIVLGIYIWLIKYSNAKDIDQFERFTRTGFELFYDRFLKLNQQQDGIESYSKFLDLLINYDKQNALKMQ